MEAPEQMQSNWKEAGSTAVALAIVAVTLFLIYQTFQAAPDSAGKKDVLLIAVSLLGTVTGYYFGRVPSERRAEAAEETSRKAERRELETRAATRQNVEAALDALRAPVPDVARGFDGQRAAITKLEALRDVL
jgi:hypothetical protein